MYKETAVRAQYQKCALFSQPMFRLVLRSRSVFDHLGILMYAGSGNREMVFIIIIIIIIIIGGREGGKYNMFAIRNKPA